MGSRHPSGATSLSWTLHFAASVPPPRALALLLGPGTASSGEFIAAALLAHPHVRSFGQATAGLTTGNMLLPLKSGGLLAIASTRLSKADGTLISGALTPDVRLPEAGARVAAKAWVVGECGVAGESMVRH